jgi:carbonic anhydrase/acetyltransferase-like protein (isoleucine patch superfamily)
MPRKAVGRAFSSCYKLAIRLRAKVFSVLISGAFSRFGEKSVLQFPIRLSGEDRIEIGARVFVGSNSWLQTLPDGKNTTPALFIGDGTSIAGACVISAVRQVVLEENVLLARNVYISDHIHRYSDDAEPILAQGTDKIAPVVIRRNSWLGQNVVVCPGVTIGVGAVIGANSVVNTDIPDRSVAVGAPAKVVKKIGAEHSLV